MSILCNSLWNVLKQIPVKYHHFSFCSSQFVKMIPFPLLLYGFVIFFYSIKCSHPNHSIMYQSISIACNLRTFISCSFNRSQFINTNHSSTILYMNCMQSVIMPMNHSCFTTVYQSLCTTIENEGIHYKLQFFLQILVIPVAIINSILHATQNKTFLENGNNRIKHCVKPMK